jgi:DNA helicase II / ATP-dependent DNA helicase PcrA
MSKYLNLVRNANEKQREAILERTGHCIVKAGPGTGKTRTLVLKAATLLYEHVFPPRGIACVTYTQAMAYELREKLGELGVVPQQNVFIGTLHGFCLTYILLPFARIYGYPLPDPIRVMAEADQAKLYEKLWFSFHPRINISDYKPEYIDGVLVERLPIIFQKYRRTQLDGIQSEGFNQHVTELVNQYETALIEKGLVDFDLIIKWAMEIVESKKYVRQALEAKFPWLLVDEYQDVGLPLHRMVKSLTQSTEMKLFAIGDPNQCIYGFSGASPDYLNELCNMPATYGKHISLEINYRSRPAILSSASIVAPEPVVLEANRDDSPGIVKILAGNRLLDILDTAINKAKIPYNRIMVLNRTRVGCRSLVQQIQGSRPDIPIFNSAQEVFDYRRPLLDWLGKLMLFVLQDQGRPDIRFQELCVFWQALQKTHGASNYDAASLRMRLSLFNAVENSKEYTIDANSWLAYIKESLALETLLDSYALRSPDEVSEFQKLENATETEGVFSELSLFDIQDRIHRKNRVYIGTLHSSKGQENTTVIIANAENLNAYDEDRQDQYRRLFYVGITRAKDHLFITRNRFTYLANELEKGLLTNRLSPGQATSGQSISKPTSTNKENATG